MRGGGTELGEAEGLDLEVAAGRSELGLGHEPRGVWVGAVAARSEVVGEDADPDIVGVGAGRIDVLFLDPAAVPLGALVGFPVGQR